MRFKPYKIEIIVVDNGYIARLENDNHDSKVFTVLQNLLIFVQNYFEENK